MSDEVEYDRRHAATYMAAAGIQAHFQDGYPIELWLMDCREAGFTIRLYSLLNAMNLRTNMGLAAARMVCNAFKSAFTPTAEDAIGLQVFLGTDHPTV